MPLCTQAHSKALQVTANKLGPEVFERQLRPLAGKVDFDAAGLSASVLARVVERSEVGLFLWRRRVVVQHVRAEPPIDSNDAIPFGYVLRGHF